jgi:hypothetical protein
LEREEQLIVEIAYNLQENLIVEGKDQMMICFRCLDIDDQEKFEVDEQMGPVCKMCTKPTGGSWDIFRNADYAPPITARQTTTITITETETITSPPINNDRKRKGQGQRQREKKKNKQYDTVITIS